MERETIILDGITWYVMKRTDDGMLISRSMNGLPPGPCCRETGPSWCNAWRCAWVPQAQCGEYRTDGGS